jgi:competence protein ComEA
MKVLSQAKSNYPFLFVFLFFYVMSSGVAPLQSAEKKSEARVSKQNVPDKIDINTATQAELETLPGVGPAVAAEIISARPFNSVDELERIPGIGEARFKEMRKHVAITDRSSKADGKRKAYSTKEATKAARDSSSAKGNRIDLNRADAETLERLPGVGATTAQNIIAARPFASVDELKKVSGIGEARFKEIRSLVTVEKSSARGVGRPPGSSARSNRGTNPETAADTAPDQPRDGKTSAANQSKININTATKEELESLRGIGPVKAQAIIDNRPYQSIEEVMTVRGIKEGTFKQIEDRITVR